MSQLQRAPKISIISSEVARSLSKQRGSAKQNDFIEYSKEWQRLRDAKVQHLRFEREIKL